MEFEGDKPVSEAERHLAESRSVTLQPIHTDVAPEALPAEAVAAAHLNGEVIGNVIGDIEQEAPLVQPLASGVAPAASTTLQKGRTLRITLTVVGLVLFVLVILFIIFGR
jgi:hypothetical protein